MTLDRWGRQGRSGKEEWVGPGRRDMLIKKEVSDVGQERGEDYVIVYITISDRAQGCSGH